jgi:hypothetical protein
MTYQEFQVSTTSFHYTSEEGFRGIIESKKLWFSDLRSTNDPRELVLGLARIRPIAERIISERKDEWNVAIYKSMLDRTLNTHKNTDFFSCCFSPFGDKLPMWQQYANAGKGLSIGFRPRALVDFPGRMQKISYVEGTDGDEDLYGIVLEMLSKLSNYKINLPIEKEIDFSSEFLAKCTNTKHVTWEYENEIRCVYSQGRDWSDIAARHVPSSLMSDGSEYRPSSPLARKVNGKDVRYIAMPYGKYNSRQHDPSGSIELVIIGPHCALSPSEVEAILLGEGFERFKVIKSNCVWR